MSPILVISELYLKGSRKVLPVVVLALLDIYDGIERNGHVSCRGSYVHKLEGTKTETKIRKREREEERHSGLLHTI